MAIMPDVVTKGLSWRLWFSGCGFVLACGQRFHWCGFLGFEGFRWASIPVFSWCVCMVHGVLVGQSNREDAQ